MKVCPGDVVIWSRTGRYADSGVSVVTDQALTVVGCVDVIVFTDEIELVIPRNLAVRNDRRLRFERAALVLAARRSRHRPAVRRQRKKAAA